MKNTAIVLAGGSGSRMNTTVKKQYLLLEGIPVLCYSLYIFQNNPQIDEIIIVCGKGEIEQCRQEIVDKYNFTKVQHIVEGGKERYHSVYEGLKAAENCQYVLIHDGARPFLDQKTLMRILEDLPQQKASVAAVPVKDTIKKGNTDGYVSETLPRECLWTVQTPQAFSYELIRAAYDKLIKESPADIKITDDAMVAEYFSHVQVKLVEGSYENIKITTPEDLLLARVILEQRKDHKNE